jgi:hypothetical protein
MVLILFIWTTGTAWERDLQRLWHGAFEGTFPCGTENIKQNLNQDSSTESWTRSIPNSKQTRYREINLLDVFNMKNEGNRKQEM